MGGQLSLHMRRPTKVSPAAAPDIGGYTLCDSTLCESGKTPPAYVRLEAEFTGPHR
jgi:hypothetical protein